MEFIVTELEGREREDRFGEGGALLSMHKLSEATNINSDIIKRALEKGGVRRRAVKTAHGTAQTIPVEGVPTLMRELGKKRNQAGEVLYPWAGEFAMQIAQTGRGEIEVPVPRLGGVRRRLTYRSPNS